ncbi:ATP-binding protein [Sphingorhabdus sp.]|uniref:ATP-binding protein n=1 Tax=Sphingorhabdus sp. TaxID=1902408 RepID=UPI00391BA258
MLTFVFILIIDEFQRQEDLSLQVETSYLSRAQIGELLAIHQDIELGQRGYILTGNKDFLEPYVNARPQLEQLFGRVETVLAQSALLIKLEAISDQKLEFVNLSIAMARGGDFEGARQLIADGRGKDLMDQIRAGILELDRAEYQRLADRQAAVRRARLDVQLWVFVIFAGLCAALIFAMFIVSKAWRARGEATQKYRDLSARQEAIFEGAKDGMLIVNQSGSIETLNGAAAAMTGYARNDLIRRDIGSLFEVAPDQGNKETFLRRLAQRSRESGSDVIELIARRKDGTLFPCDVAISSVKLAEGQAFVAIVRDTTERRRVEQLKSEFVSTVSHELRTPLTSIAGSLGLIQGGAAGEVSERAARLIEIARDNSQRLVRLINDILDMEKLEAGRMKFVLQPLVLASFLNQAIEANLGYAQQYSVSLVVEPVPPNATVIADPDLLMQVMANLISNATKFSETGGEVVVRALSLDRRWRISVADRGIGISEAFRSRVFGKFAQAEASDARQKGGTGLGLSIVREIVHRMGGEISFETEVGAGSTFHVDLPAERRASNRVETNSGLYPSVLHVEDDPDVLAIVADALEGRFQLASAQTLAEARTKLLRSKYDVVILDVALPDGSGKELLNELGDTLVLVFSAQDIDQDLANRADAVLTKSRASLSCVVETLYSLLAKSEIESEGT